MLKRASTPPPHPPFPTHSHRLPPPPELGGVFMAASPSQTHIHTHTHAYTQATKYFSGDPRLEALLLGGKKVSRTAGQKSVPLSKKKPYTPTSTPNTCKCGNLVLSKVKVLHKLHFRFFAASVFTPLLL